MTRSWLLVVGVAACGSKSDPQQQQTQQPPPAADAAPPDAAVATDWASCEKTLRDVMKLPATKRVEAILDGCKPCGDWTPLLQWDKAQPEGGPTRAQIEQAMVACKAYCDGNAKSRFLGTLDNARGKGTRGPWRYLGEICKDKVSAVPDARFMSAPYFALDRIARAAGERAELAPLLEPIELALPPLSVTGSSYELASAPVTAPDAGPLALTVTPAEVRIAAAPRAKLGKDGVRVVSKGEPYPGVLVKSAKELDAAIAKLDDGAIAIYAPHGMPAAPVVAVLAWTPKREVRLASMATSDLPNWPIVGAIPIALRTTAGPKPITIALDADADDAVKRAVAAKTDIVKALAAGKPDAVVKITVGPKATVAGLAKLLGALGYFDVKSVALTTTAK